MSAANWGIGGGGGLNIFFRGRNVHQATEQKQNVLQNRILPPESMIASSGLPDENSRTMIRTFGIHVFRMAFARMTQRAPKGPPNQDPPTSGLKGDFLQFFFPSSHDSQLLGRQRQLPKTCEQRHF